MSAVTVGWVHDRHRIGGTPLRPRVLVISQIPTPYRLPVYAQLARRPELELEVVFCAAAQPDRPWDVDAALAEVPHRVLRGRSRTLRLGGDTFVYEANPEILGVLEHGRYDLLVIGGYAMLTEQLALLWARGRRTPYLLHSESHLLKERRASVRAMKRLVLPEIVGRAAGGLAVGSAAAEYLAAYGVPPGRIRIFPNTVDVATYGREAGEARGRAAAIRQELRLPERYVLFAGRLTEGKGVPDLCEALRRLGPDAPALVVAGEGPLASDLASLPTVTMAGFQQRNRLVQLLALAEATVVPSRAESWGVVVNEALACGSPVLASDAVGAAVDLLVDGLNGRIFQAGNPAALAAALVAPPVGGDPAAGRIARWTYEFAVEQVVEAVQLALGRRSS